VPALHPANGVEHGFALLLKVVKGAADEHSERIGHRVFPMTYRASRRSLFRASLSVLRDAAFGASQDEDEACSKHAERQVAVERDPRR
jgi:hypothetical protein